MCIQSKCFGDLLFSQTDTRPPKTPVKKKFVEVDSFLPTPPKGRSSRSSPAQVYLSTKNGKIKSEPNDGVRRILEDFEDEMTCPLCVVCLLASMHQMNQGSYCRCCDILYDRKFAPAVSGSEIVSVSLLISEILVVIPPVVNADGSGYPSMFVPILP